jgi:SAM-dependent methyltransferase
VSFGYDDVIVGLRRSYDARVDEREGAGVEPWKEAERARYLELLRTEGRTALLDIGAAAGIHAEYFAAAGLDVTCIDLSPAMVERCRAKGLAAHVQDVLHLDLPRRYPAAFAVNSLLHIPPADLPVAFERIRAVLDPGAPFYLGQYGGVAFEGTWPGDTYEPKRYFSRLTDERLCEIASGVFAIVDFRVVAIGAEVGHFQALTLRAPG